MNRSQSLLNIAFATYNRGHEDIAQELAIAAFESEDASEIFASEETVADTDELTVEQIDKLSDVAADIAEAGHSDIAQELVEVLTAACEAKVESDDADADANADADADLTTEEIEAILAEAGDDDGEAGKGAGDGDDGEAGKGAGDGDEGEGAGDGEEEPTAAETEVLDQGSVRKLRCVANKIAAVSGGSYRDQAKRIMEAVAKLQETIE